MTAAAAGLLLGALALGSGAGKADEPAVDPRAPRGGDARGTVMFSDAIRTIGTTRTSQFYSTSGDENVSVEIVAGQELDVRSMTIYAGNNDSDFTTGPRGQVYIRHQLRDPDTSLVIHFFDVNENGATHYTFPTPLALREGDDVEWRPIVGGTSDHELIQVTFHGTVPVESSGAMVR